MKRSTFKTAAVAAGTVALVAALAACAPAAQEPAAAPSGGESDAPAAAAPAETPEPDSFGVVVAESWKDIYPNEYQTYMANESNSPQGKQDYLTEYPELVTMYAGYGFAKGYDEAAGHPYSLQSVAETPRVNENTLANCITCKTPQYTAMVNSEGDSAYQKPFAEVLMQMTEPISCYNCHENDPTKTTVTQKFFVNSMGSDVDKVSTDSQVCGQCHNEYYFAPETKATTNPYTGLEGMTADCHMAPAKAEDGTEYSSHNLVNPTEDPAIMEKCEGCHADLPGQIVQWQKETTDREHELAAKLDAYIKTLAEQKDSLDEATLEQARQIHRHAQFYWDYVMVENSEGAHNPGLAQENLDKCEDELKAGYTLLNMTY